MAIEISDHAYEATVRIVQTQRDWVEVQKQRVEKDNSDLNYDAWHQAKDELEIMERIMRNLGLDC